MHCKGHVCLVVGWSPCISGKDWLAIKTLSSDSPHPLVSNVFVWSFIWSSPVTFLLSVHECWQMLSSCHMRQFQQMECNILVCQFYEQAEGTIIHHLEGTFILWNPAHKLGTKKFVLGHLETPVYIKCTASPIWCMGADCEWHYSSWSIQMLQWLVHSIPFSSTELHAWSEGYLLHWWPWQLHPPSISLHVDKDCLSN